MAYCWKCGKPLPEDAKFCIYCGAPVKIPETDNIEIKPEKKQGLYYDPSAAKKEEKVEYKFPETAEEKPVKTKNQTGDLSVRSMFLSEVYDGRTDTLKLAKQIYIRLICGWY